jgi:eukaryotic-like serine/threonine-protein kinase
MLGMTLATRYKITQPLGSGGFGETYLAEDKLCKNSICVVKQIN